jgi:hypothetical protein
MMPSTVPTENAQPYSKRSKALGVIFALTMLGFAVGMWGFGPYFIREMRRLEPWQAVLIWLGDATTLFWFAFFVARHYLSGEPLRERSWSAFKREKQWLIALFSFLLAAGLDLAITLGLMYEDHTRFSDAEVVEAEVVRIMCSAGATWRHFELQCRYQDKQRQSHEGFFLVSEYPPETNFPAAVPAAVAQNIRQQQTPFAIRVSYDPHWPGRSWLTDFGWNDGNRLHYVSLLMPIFQVWGLLMLAIAVAAYIKDYGIVPWWFDLHQVAPFIAQVLFLAFVGPPFRLSAMWVWKSSAG